MKLYITFDGIKTKTIIVDLGCHKFKTFDGIVFDYNMSFEDGTLCEKLPTEIAKIEKETNRLLSEAEATLEDWLLYGNVAVEKDMLKSMIGLLSTAIR